MGGLVGSGVTSAGFDFATSMTSPFVIRPSLPDPLIAEGLIPVSSNSFLTAGDCFSGLFDEDGDGVERMDSVVGFSGEISSTGVEVDISSTGLASMVGFVPEGA